MSSAVESCPRCSSEPQHFQKVYFDGEDKFYEHVMCTVCWNLVTSAVILDSLGTTVEDQKENDPAFVTAWKSNQDNFNDPAEFVADVSDVICKTDLEEDGYARCGERVQRSRFSDVSNKENPVGNLRSCPRRLKHSSSALEVESDHSANTGASATALRSRPRRLKNSVSSEEFREQPADMVGSGHSATPDNGELSHDSLKQARELCMRQLACLCNIPGSQMLPVEGVDNVFYCSACLNLCGGVDDSINVYELIELQKGHYVVEACAECGNTDPNLFMFEEGNDPHEITLRCLRCSLGQYSGVVEVEDEDNPIEDWIKEWITYECKCKNGEPELQRITVDIDNSIVFVKCWVCQREDMITLDQPRVCSCKDNSGSIDVEFDEYGFASKIACSQCKAAMDCGESCDIAAGGDGTPSGRSRIESLSELKPGDHIALHQWLGYWHHAIVTDVKPTRIRVMHYNGPNLPNKGKISEDWLPVDAKNEELYRVNYKPSDCNHPKIVMERARTRIGECRYNILRNNCEHFARWCKTGHKRSLQSESFIRSMLQRCFTFLQSATVDGAKWLLRSDAGNAVIKHGTKMIANAGSGGAAVSVAGDVTLKQAGAFPALGTFVTPALMVTREIQLVCRDIRDAANQRRDGQITRKEFLKITIKRTTEGVGAIAGVGMALAIPYTRNSIGCTLGSVIGHGAGAIAGRLLCGRYGKSNK